MSDVKRRTLALVAEINADEIACRIVEAMGSCRRPTGMTATEALNTMPDHTAAARLAAFSVLEYFSECVKNGERPQ